MRSPAASTGIRPGPTASARSTSTAVTNPWFASSFRSTDVRRDPAMTRAPSPTNALVIANPIPRPAPVTTTDLPVSPRSIAISLRHGRSVHGNNTSGLVRAGLITAATLGVVGAASPPC